MALRRPDAGWHSPLAAVARDASVTVPHFSGIQDSVNRCQARSATGSSRAGCQDPPSTLISTWPTPPSAQAQPQISVALEALTAASGAGATITDCWHDRPNGHGATACRRTFTLHGVIVPALREGPRCALFGQRHP